MKKTVLAFALPIIFASSAFAADVEPNPVRFMVGIGLTAGGDNIATVQYTDGSSSNISAGTGLQMMVGLDYRITDAFSVQTSVGYQARFTPAASNGSATFQRYPIELLGYYHPDQNWLSGGGVRFVESPKVTASGAASGIGEDFKNTTGAVLEVEYFFTPHTSMKVRGVKESYKPTYGGQSISGNHIGIFATTTSKLLVASSIPDPSPSLSAWGGVAASPIVPARRSFQSTTGLAKSIVVPFPQPIIIDRLNCPASRVSMPQSCRRRPNAKAREKGRLWTQ